MKLKSTILAAPQSVSGPDEVRAPISFRIALFFFLAMSMGRSWPQTQGAEAAEPKSETDRSATLFAPENLIAWCVVPFDSRRRGPEERAQMLRRLDFTRLAYDWRDEHIPSFDEEMETLGRYDIKLQAFWFPSAINSQARAILDLLERHRIETELWVTMDLGPIEATDEEHRARIEKAAEILRPIAREAARIGCKVGLYNHGGWFGEPENQIAIIEQMQLGNIGIVYNLHHGHAQLDRFAELLEMLTPYLFALNLNGMDSDGEIEGRKILRLGQGKRDGEVIAAILASRYEGPIGILGHTQDDVEDTLLDNLEGLRWLLKEANGAKAEPPLYRTGPDAPREDASAPSLGAEGGRPLIIRGSSR